MSLPREGQPGFSGRASGSSDRDAEQEERDGRRERERGRDRERERRQRERHRPWITPPPTVDDTPHHLSTYITDDDHELQREEERVHNKGTRRRHSKAPEGVPRAAHPRHSHGTNLSVDNLPDGEDAVRSRFDLAPLSTDVIPRTHTQTSYRRASQLTGWHAAGAPVLSSHREPQPRQHDAVVPGSRPDSQDRRASGGSSDHHTLERRTIRRLSPNQEAELRAAIVDGFLRSSISLERIQPSRQVYIPVGIKERSRSEEVVPTRRRISMAPVLGDLNTADSVTASARTTTEFPATSVPHDARDPAHTHGSVPARTPRQAPAKTQGARQHANPTERNDDSVAMAPPARWSSGGMRRRDSRAPHEEDVAHAATDLEGLFLPASESVYIVEAPVSENWLSSSPSLSADDAVAEDSVHLAALSSPSVPLRRASDTRGQATAGSGEYERPLLSDFVIACVGHIGRSYGRAVDQMDGDLPYLPIGPMFSPNSADSFTTIPLKRCNSVTDLVASVQEFQVCASVESLDLPARRTPATLTIPAVSPPSPASASESAPSAASLPSEALLTERPPAAPPSSPASGTSAESVGTCALRCEGGVECRLCLLVGGDGCVPAEAPRCGMCLCRGALAHAHPCCVRASGARSCPICLYTYRLPAGAAVVRNDEKKKKALREIAVTAILLWQMLLEIGAGAVRAQRLTDPSAPSLLYLAVSLVAAVLLRLFVGLCQRFRRYARGLGVGFY